MTRKKIKRRLNKFSIKYLWPLLPALFLVGVTILLGQLKIFNLKNISCYVDNHQCSLEFEPFLVSLVNQNIFKLKKYTTINQLLEIDNNLVDIKINKTLPDSLKIESKRRVAIAKVTLVEDLDFTSLTSTQSATISGRFSQKFSFLDRSGEIYEKKIVSNEKLPRILLNPSTDFKLGITPVSQHLSNLISSLNENYVSYEEIAKVSKNIVIVKTTLGPFSIFDLNKSISQQSTYLQFVLSNIKIGEVVPIKIDLRFDKPILTY